MGNLKSKSKKKKDKVVQNPEAVAPNAYNYEGQIPQQGSVQPNNPEPKPLASNSKKDETIHLIRALYSYSARESGDLDIIAGELLEVLDDKPDGWWFVKSRQTGMKGWVPSNYTASEQSLYNKNWYYGDVDRAEADQLLTRPGMTKGTFLVRKSRDQILYAISLLDYDVMEGMAEINPVKHYKIKNKDEKFFVVPQNMFPTLEGLISFYQENPGPFVCQLITPCPREYNPSTHGLSRGMRDKWEVSRESLELGEKLGSGQFGEVYKALWQHSVNVAVKAIKGDLVTHDDKAAFLREAETMKGLDHPKLVCLYAVCTEEEPFYIITEYMAHGALHNYLRKNTGKFSLSILINFGVQVAAAMEYLEFRNFIHRDLAARNVLVGDNYEAKVADFGMARFIPDNVYYSESILIPYKWSAPESLERQKFTHKSDVWSFGVLMYEILTHGGKPYPGVQNHEILKHLKLGNRLERPELKNGNLVPEELYNTSMLSCWASNPESRPSFSSLRSFLEKYSSKLMLKYEDTDINVGW